KSLVALVDELEDVFGAAQDGDEARRLLEQALLALGLGGDALLGLDPFGRLDADDQDAADARRAAVVADGAVAVGPVDFLALAVPGDRHQLVHVPGGAAAGHHLLDLRPDDVPD